MKPTDEQALQFAIMLAAGLPAAEAIVYFVDTQDPAEMAMILRNWTRSTVVRAAVARLQKKPWTEMSLNERCVAALDQHYNALAYMLYSVNYIEASTTDKQKLDTARSALEQKLAGTSGKVSPIDQFFADLNAGKLHLNKASAASLGTKN